MSAKVNIDGKIYSGQSIRLHCRTISELGLIHVDDILVGTFKPGGYIQILEGSQISSDPIIIE